LRFFKKNYGVLNGKEGFVKENRNFEKNRVLEEKLGFFNEL